MMKNWLLLIPGLVLTFSLAACSDNNDSSVTGGMGDDESLSFVTVDLMNNSGDSIGTAELTEEDEGIRVKLNAKNLPEGPHGFHFHESGKCEVPNFESAGGHFNPTDTSHGVDHEEGPHAGDLPNFIVGEDGKIVEEFLAEHVTLKGREENSLLQEGGTALIIHAEADDGKTQPSGDSGDRIVCGVIE